MAAQIDTAYLWRCKAKYLIRGFTWDQADALCRPEAIVRATAAVLPPSAGETAADTAAVDAGAPPVVVDEGLPWGWILGGLAVGGVALYYLNK